MCAMMQKFLMVSMGVWPTAGGGAAGDARRRPAGQACSGTEDTGIPPRSRRGTPHRSSSLLRGCQRATGHARAAASMVARRGNCPLPSPARPRAGVPRARGGAWASALAELRAAPRDRGLAVRGLVLVNDALAGGLVQAVRRGAHRHGRRLHVAGVGRLAELAYRGLQRRLDGLVALPRLLVLLIALDLGLDIRHAEASLRFWFLSVGAGGFRTRGSPTNSMAGRNTPTRKDIPIPAPRSNRRPHPPARAARPRVRVRVRGRW